MPTTLPAFAFRSPSADPRGLALAAPSVGASQRASLGRSVAFVLLLSASSLASVYTPSLLHGPDWVQGTAPGPLETGR